MEVTHVRGHDPGKDGVHAALRPVSSVMSSPATCVHTSTTLGDALQMLLRRGLRHLVVVDDTGRCMGVLSDRSIAAAWAADPMCLPRQTVVEVIDRVPATLDSGAHVVDAARLMRTARTDAVAIIDAAGVTAGIVTGSDLIATLAP